ncbi:WD40 repeat domain-containing serine/threonine protein kinase [Streptomyces beijiangensis]|uniref:Serine/threonine protein kinase n=1 Tax=Streptomyces beijiangensis TaxID=163361 RepID=A0A939JLA0_9ACTN|nr:serine/threonine-protein kinase [Streptomyces beijiangensis]MBO0515509.1 serine/threonine protein kinase [Streptomyces beijiangensis]
MDELTPADPQWVGPYRLDGRLGAGGMGNVYLGTSPGGRKVAVKLIRAELADSPSFRTRFAREVAAARKVGGFHTAQVVDADPEATEPWLVTAYVPGPTLHQAVADGGPLKPDAVLRLGAGLAEGLDAIHQCGLIHRDLKPGNVIIGEDGPRIIDFGIARAVDASSLTATGTIIGTYAYMSPEQIHADRAGPAGDVFSLGSVLAFAATGRSPFDAPTILEVVQRILDQEPMLDSLDGELHQLLTACLAKDPAGRPDVAGLAAAFAGAPVGGAAVRPPDPRLPAPQRTLHLGPVDRAPGAEAAVPESTPYAHPVYRQPGPPPRPPYAPRPETGRGSGGVSRRALLIGGAAAAAAATAVGVPLLMRHQGADSGTPAGRSTKSGSPAAGTSGSDAVALVGPPEVQGIAFSPDSKSLFASGGDGAIWRWDVATRHGTATRIAIAAYMQQNTFTTDAKLLMRVEENKVRLWNVATGRTVKTFTGITSYKLQDGFIAGASLSPDGKTLAASTGKGLYVWDVASGGLITIHKDAKYGPVRYSPDGKLLVCGQPLQLREMPSGRILATLDVNTASEDVAFSPDSQILAITELNYTVRLWNTSSKQDIISLKGHKNTIHKVAFHPDGRMLASVDQDGTARLWDTVTGKTTATFTGPNSFETVAFSPDGKRLTAGLMSGSDPSSMDTVRMWPVP